MSNRPKGWKRRKRKPQKENSSPMILIGEKELRHIESGKHPLFDKDGSLRDGIPDYILTENQFLVSNRMAEIQKPRGGDS